MADDTNNSGYKETPGKYEVKTQRIDKNNDTIVVHDVSPTGEEVYQIQSSKAEVKGVKQHTQTNVVNNTHIVLGNAVAETYDKDDKEKGIKKGDVKTDKDGNAKIKEKKVKISGSTSTDYDKSAGAWKKELADGSLSIGSSIASIPADLAKSTVEGFAMGFGEELADRASKKILDKIKGAAKEGLKFRIIWGCPMDSTGFDYDFEPVEFTNLMEVEILRLGGDSNTSGGSEQNGETEKKRQAAVIIKRKLDGKRLGFVAMTNFLDKDSIYKINNTELASGGVPTAPTTPSLPVSTPDVIVMRGLVEKGGIYLEIDGVPKGGLLPSLPGPFAKTKLVYRFNNVVFTEYNINLYVNNDTKTQYDIGDYVAEIIKFTGDIGDEDPEAPRI